MKVERSTSSRTRPFSIEAALFTLLMAVFLLSAASSPSLAASIQVEKVASNLDKPISLTTAGDGSGRIFINLQGGKIVILDGSTVLQKPFLDIGSKVSCCGERGLLGLAFHPKYKENGLFFLNYTDTRGNTVIARYKVSNDPNLADPNSETILLTIDQPYPNHNGGQILFGPDGYLYIGMGDGGSGGDPGNRSQKLGELLGKMLRIDVDGKPPYGIPPNNPFVSQPGAKPEIWAYGLRNPWRFSFDRETKEMFIADVGQNRWEEVHLQPADSKGGENYGWRLMEGNHCFNPPRNCEDPKLVRAILEYDHSLGCSITGGFVYRGSRIPELAGTYLYGDYCSGRIWGGKRAQSGTWSATQLLKDEYAISTFGEDEKGEILFADYRGGSLYRIVGYQK